MKKYNKIIQYSIASALFFFLLSACVENNMDYSKPDYVKEGSVMDVLTKNPDYSKFCELLSQTGYDSLLYRGDLFTVFAPDNQALSGVTLPAGREELKAIAGMHLAPSSLYRSVMTSKRLQSVSGKMLKIEGAVSDGVLVNGIPVSDFDQRAVNGVIHKVKGVILPAVNLYDAVGADPELSLFKEYIDTNFEYVIDPDNNIKLGYDTLNIPIYQEPIIYIKQFNYLQDAALKDESVLSTLFIPTDDLVRKLVADMVKAKGGVDRVVPSLGYMHGDTLIAGRYFKYLAPYEGDTAALYNELFRHICARGEYPVVGKNSSYTNISGGKCLIKESDIEGEAKEVSNGYYYCLKDLKVPELFYRKPVMFLPLQKVPDPADPDKTINNPAIMYEDGAKYSASVAKPNGVCYTGKFSRFDFTKIGGKIDFSIPDVVKGKYKVLLSYFPETNAGTANASYGTIPLMQNIQMSSLFNSRTLRYVVKDLGTIQVNADGPVRIGFTCVDSSPAAAGKYTFGVDYLMLEPVADTE